MKNKHKAGEKAYCLRLHKTSYQQIGKHIGTDRHKARREFLKFKNQRHQCNFSSDGVSLCVLIAENLDLP
jgi:hypothetical protein